MMSAEQRQRWAQAMIRRAAGSVPRYGTPEWLALPDGPEKVASVVLAAEAWAREGDDLGQQLVDEIDMQRVIAKRREDAEYVANYQAHRREWSRKDWRPHPANARPKPSPRQPQTRLDEIIERGRAAGEHDEAKLLEFISRWAG